MVRLFCAVVGEAGSVFPVDIDGTELVGDLKDKVLTKKRRIVCGADELRIYKVRTKDGGDVKEQDDIDMERTKGDVEKRRRDEEKEERAWLPSTAPLVDSAKKPPIPDQLQPFLNAGAIDPAAEVDDAFATVPRNGVILVLVGVPENAVLPGPAPKFSLAVPRGPEVDLVSSNVLLEFLEGEMSKKDMINSSPHILEAESLRFQLVGRDEAIAIATECFESMINRLERGKLKIPVCSGISGLGETRMLEESGRIWRDKFNLDAKQVTSIIVPYVPYFNGSGPQHVENSMPIETSFSWRLL